MNSWLIIGYGNTLRNDDGVGQIIAQTIEKSSFLNVKCIYQHQLTPELVENIKLFQNVIFIDASVESLKVDVINLPRFNINNYAEYGHYCNPEYLLYLTKLIYNESPKSYLITIPIENIDLGENLSPLAKKGMEKAVKIITEMIF
ncbi:hydrogenase maturation protease [Geminocystis sp. CENA526]|uniref:hydrogenase maturation protease n=1 Tax=Geminocystis sp. CENA526 TaxID=1355871 RepID=UPI003D70214C